MSELEARPETEAEANARRAIRRQYVATAVGQFSEGNPHAPLQLTAIAALLPDDFELGMDDLAPYIMRVVPEPPADVTGEMHAAEQPDTMAEPQAPVAPDTIEAATARRITADRTLADARVALITAGNVERAARDKLAKAITAFQSGFAPITQTELMRQHAAEQNAIRGAIARGEMPGRPGPKIGKSAIDRVAYYSRGGNAQAGGGLAFRRGATTHRGHKIG